MYSLRAVSRPSSSLARSGSARRMSEAVPRSSQTTPPKAEGMSATQSFGKPITSGPAAPSGPTPVTRPPPQAPGSSGKPPAPAQPPTKPPSKGSSGISVVRAAAFLTVGGTVAYGMALVRSLQDEALRLKVEKYLPGAPEALHFLETYVEVKKPAPKPVKVEEAPKPKPAAPVAKPAPEAPKAEVRTEAPKAEVKAEAPKADVKPEAPKAAGDKEDSGSLESLKARLQTVGSAVADEATAAAHVVATVVAATEDAVVAAVQHAPEAAEAAVQHAVQVAAHEAEVVKAAVRDAVKVVEEVVEEVKYTIAEATEAESTDSGSSSSSSSKEAETEAEPGLPWAASDAASEQASESEAAGAVVVEEAASPASTGPSILDAAHIPHMPVVDPAAVTVDAEDAEAAEAVVVAEVLKGLDEPVADTHTPSREAILLHEARRRLAILEKELAEQAEGEIVRLQHVLARQSDEDARERAAALSHQRDEHERILAQKVEELRAEYEALVAGERERLREEKHKEIQDHLKVQDAKHQDALRTQLNQQAHAIWEASEANLKLKVGHERANRLAVVERLVAQIKALEATVAARAALDAKAVRIYNMAAAVESMAAALETRQPIAAQVRALTALAPRDEVVAAVVAALPEHGLQQGVCTQEDLLASFPKVRDIARRVMTVPENGGLWSHLVSHAVSLVSLPRHGLVDGDDVEAILARAEYHLQRRNIEQATRELNQLKGMAKYACRDWLADARAHLELAQSIDIIRSHLSILSLTLLTTINN